MCAIAGGRASSMPGVWALGWVVSSETRCRYVHVSSRLGHPASLYRVHPWTRDANVLGNCSCIALPPASLQSCWRRFQKKPPNSYCQSEKPSPFLQTSPACIHTLALLLLLTVPFKDAEERGATGRSGQGWPVQGRTDQEGPSNRCHQATKDEGSRIATIRPGCTFFWLLCFVHAKKSNSPLAGETSNTIKRKTSKVFAF